MRSKIRIKSLPTSETPSKISCFVTTKSLGLSIIKPSNLRQYFIKALSPFFLTSSRISFTESFTCFEISALRDENFTAISSKFPLKSNTFNILIFSLQCINQIKYLVFFKFQTYFIHNHLC